MTAIKRKSSGSLTKLVCGALFIAVFLLQPPTGNAQWTTPDSNQNINNTNTGNVGIGTSSPGKKLEVLATDGEAARLYRNASTVGWGVNIKFAFNNSNGMKVDYAGVHGITANTTAGAEAGDLVLSTATSGTLTEKLRVTSTGYVGIGTASPAERLVTFGNFLAGNITSRTQLYSTYDSQSNAIMELGYGTATSNITPFASLVLSKNLTSTNNLIGMISFANSNIANGNEKRLAIIHTWTDGALNSGALVMSTTSAGTANERMRITASGNVGIGTSSPAYRLDVQGGAVNAASGLCIAGDCKTAWSQVGGPSQWSGAPNIYYNSGSVGIGTSSPLALLDVRNSDGTFYAGFGYGTNKETFIRAGSSTTGVLHVGDLNTSKTLLQESGGTVGIGTATPNSQYKLDVAGNINSSGTITGNNIIAKYQDVAEWVRSSEKLSAGTVVVLDATRSNEVIRSTQAYDTRVAGVISEQPGIALGEKSDDKVLVAASGRVKVKVDASHTPIQIGDLLVASDIPGVAMKSLPITFGGVQMHRPGTLIGKALEPLEKGTGEILVLLSLQ